MANYAVYIGTSADGIQKAVLDTSAMELSEFTRQPGASNYGFLALHPRGDVLFAAGECSEEDPVFASFSIDGENGDLKLLSQLHHPYVAPHIQPDRTGRFLFAGAYRDSALLLFHVGEDGAIGPLAAEYTLSGSGVNRERQEASHPHCAIAGADNRTVLVADFGADKMLLYALDAAAGSLSLLGQADTPPGSGPRHFAYHPNGLYAYVATELSNEALVYHIDYETGALLLLQRAATMPSGYVGASFAGDAQITSDGKLLFVSNRGHSSMAVFAVDPDSGLLALRSINKTRCAVRNMIITPDDKYILCVGEPFSTQSAFEVLGIDPVNAETTLLPVYTKFDRSWGLGVAPIG